MLFEYKWNAAKEIREMTLDLVIQEERKNKKKKVEKTVLVIQLYSIENEKQNETKNA